MLECNRVCNGPRIYTKRAFFLNDQTLPTLFTYSIRKRPEVALDNRKCYPLVQINYCYCECH